MRVLVIGCGSIGRRRARLLAEMGCDVGVYDSRSDVMMGAARSNAHYPHRYWVYRDKESAFAASDAAFLCTPADTHLPLAAEALHAGCAVFVEKPLSTTLDGAQDLLRAADGRVAMGACNLRFAYGLPRQDYARLDFVVSQPLHRWREGAVAAYRRNGIVLEMAIHELDMAYAWAGPISNIEVEGDEDAVVMRVLHANTTRATITADWRAEAGTARYVDALPRGEAPRRYQPDTSDAMYRAEMTHFLDCVRTGARPCCTLDDAAHVLRWALRARDLIRARV